MTVVHQENYWCEGPQTKIDLANRLRNHMTQKGKSLQESYLQTYLVIYHVSLFCNLGDITTSRFCHTKPTWNKMETKHSQTNLHLALYPIESNPPT